MRIFAIPKSGISYNECFYRALEAEGTQVADGIFSGRWLVQNLRPNDIVHLHWPAFTYGGAASGLGQLFGFLRFLLLLLLIRAKGGRICWTAHNLLPHDRAVFPYVDVIARKVLILLSKRIFVHGASAARALGERFPHAQAKLVEIQHGHWIDYYPSGTSFIDARRKLGIPADRFVYLFIGLCKEYKNLDGLIETFAQIPGDAVLLIAGKFQRTEYQSRISSVAKMDARVRLEARFIPDDELQYYMAAANVVVAPYRDVLTSGTAMLALSFGRPVVSVSAGFLRDVITEDCGILYDPGHPCALRTAMEKARLMSFDKDTILRRASQFSWKKSAQTFMAAIT